MSRPGGKRIEGGGGGGGGVRGSKLSWMGNIDVCVWKGRG